jgi:RNA ligase (TIGR02306 family)
MANIERKLASVQRIAEVRSIPEADRICAYRVNGWWVVDSVGKYEVGDLAVYLEPDSFVPHVLDPTLSKGKEPKEYKGVRGEKLRTIRLKKQLSQGLLLPFVETLNGGFFQVKGDDGFLRFVREGDDVTELLGIQKWEAPVPACLAGQVRGNFPSYITKTDQPRVQSLYDKLGEYKNVVYEVTEKLEGTSCTMYLNNGEFGVCSRNLDLKEDNNNTYWSVARKVNLEEKLKTAGFDNVAVQGEVVGPKIQQNIYKLNDFKFFVFDVYLTDMGRYMTPLERKNFCDQFGLGHVPVLGSFSIKDMGVEEILGMADGFSQLNNKTLREGIVFKSECGAFSFKSISNQYLLKSGL